MENVQTNTVNKRARRLIELCNKRNFTCFLKYNLFIPILTNVKNNFRVNKCYKEKILLCLFLTINKYSCYSSNT